MFIRILCPRRIQINKFLVIRDSLGYKMPPKVAGETKLAGKCPLTQLYNPATLSKNWVSPSQLVMGSFLGMPADSLSACLFPPALQRKGTCQVVLCSVKRGGQPCKAGEDQGRSRRHRNYPEGGTHAPCAFLCPALFSAVKSGGGGAVPEGQRKDVHRNNGQVQPTLEDTSTWCEEERRQGWEKEGGVEKENETKRHVPLPRSPCQ